jgi:hypothetical protein
MVEDIVQKNVTLRMNAIRRIPGNLVWDAIPGFVDQKLVKVAAGPTHGGLDNFMQLRQRDIGRN